MSVIAFLAPTLRAEKTNANLNGDEAMYTR